jgi:hypothetical protein
MDEMTGAIYLNFGDASGTLVCSGVCADETVAHRYENPGTYRASLVQYNHADSNPGQTALLTSKIVTVK